MGKPSSLSINCFLLRARLVIFYSLLYMPAICIFSLSCNKKLAVTHSKLISLDISVLTLLNCLANHCPCFMYLFNNTASYNFMFSLNQVWGSRSLVLVLKTFSFLVLFIVFVFCLVVGPPPMFLFIFYLILFLQIVKSWYICISFPLSFLLLTGSSNIF